MEPAIDLHEAGVIQRCDYVGPGLNDAGVFRGEHGGGDVCVLHGERSSESAALLPIGKFYEL